MLSKKLSIEDVADKIAGQRVLMRVDFNVPIKNGVVKDTTKITSTIPTINYALAKGARSIVLMSHLGRPNGKPEAKSTLKPVAEKLGELMGRQILFLNDCVGEETVKTCQNLQDGQVVLLENLRFHLEEEVSVTEDSGEKVKASEENVNKFRADLTKLGDIYINDAFGTAHRAHSSMVGVNHSIRASGLLMKKEIDYFARALETPQKPFLVIMGGAKVKDKIKLIMNMLEKVTDMIIGGGLSFTFLNYLKQMKIGKSIFDKEGVKLVDDIMKKAAERNVNIHFPVDFLCAASMEDCKNTKICTVAEGIDDDLAGFDIGPQSIDLFTKVILSSKTVFWNGPPGVFENETFSKGSIAFVNAYVELTKQGGVTIVGGGETVNAIKLVKGAENEIAHVSTGGGASLELMEGRILPGVVFLSEK